MAINEAAIPEGGLFIPPVDPLFPDVRLTDHLGEDGRVNYRSLWRAAFPDARADESDITTFMHMHTDRFDSELTDEEAARIEREFVKNPILHLLLFDFINGREVLEQTAPVSQELLANRAGELDFTHELDSYLGWFSEAQPKEYARLQRCLEQMTPTATDVYDLSCIVAIPVAAHQEAGNMYRTLANYAEQSLDPSTFEIHLFLNVPAGDEQIASDAKIPELFEQTVAGIEQAMHDFPELNIRYTKAAYTLEPESIGRIRMQQWAMIAADMQARGRDEDIVVIANDADTVALDEDYLYEMVQAQHSSGLDVIIGQMQWSQIEELPANAKLNQYLRFESIATHASNMLDSSVPAMYEASFAMSLAAYLAIGGYDGSLELAESTDVINRLRDVRQNEQGYDLPVVGYAPEALLITDSRRAIAAMALGYGVNFQWAIPQTAFSHTDALRTDKPQIEKAARLADLLAAHEWADGTIAAAERGCANPDITEYLQKEREKVGLTGFTD